MSEPMPERHEEWLDIIAATDPDTPLYFEAKQRANQTIAALSNVLYHITHDDGYIDRELRKMVSES